jgi:hypothetical protein
MADHTDATRRTGMPIATIVALLICGVAVSLRAQVVDRVIAVVSGTVILQSDARAALALKLVDASAARDPIETAMRWLIDRQLVLDEAVRGDRIDVAPAAMSEALAAARRRFKSADEFRRALDGMGLDERALERLIRDTLVARLYIEQRFDAAPLLTDEDLRAYYAAHAARFVRNGRQAPFEDVVPEVTAVLQQERRQQAEAAWMDRLRRRADIREVYQPVR